jgi:hypothetical protein
MNRKTLETVKLLKPEGTWRLVKAIARKEQEEPDVLYLVYQDEENPKVTLEQLIQKWYTEYRVKRMRIMDGKALKFYTEEL